MIRKAKSKLLICFCLLFVMGLNTVNVSAHDHGAYRDETTIQINHPEWMMFVDDSKRLSDLSIPGTHDTMAYGGYLTDIVRTQSMNLETQLKSGIRYLDIRLMYEDSTEALAVYHGIAYLQAYFGNVLQTVSRFLYDYPTETVLIRIKQENSSASNAVFDRSVRNYLDSYPSQVFDSQGGTNNNPTLGEMRGKIVILRNYAGSNLGIDYRRSFNIQDEYHLTTNWDLYSKWEHVKAQLSAANSDYLSGGSTKYINYLSGSGGSFPYFVASGHVSPGTGAARLSTGLSTVTNGPETYPDFPRTTEALGLATISFEGTNILASDKIENDALKHVGIVVSDFPGETLIHNIIQLNWIR